MKKIFLVFALLFLSLSLSLFAAPKKILTKKYVLSYMKNKEKIDEELIAMEGYDYFTMAMNDTWYKEPSDIKNTLKSLEIYDSISNILKKYDVGNGNNSVDVYISIAYGLYIVFMEKAYTLDLNHAKGNNLDTEGLFEFKKHIDTLKKKIHKYDLKLIEKYFALFIDFL